MERAERIRGALLGLALGDAWGRPLEFLKDERVRTEPVLADELCWTDDTLMALTLGEALSGLAPDAPDGAIGRAAGGALATWATDPRTREIAADPTCLQAARTWSRKRDWRACGIRSSDGSSVLPRVVPVAMTFAGARAEEAAAIAARVTHDNPHAIEAAVALTRVMAGLLAGDPLDAALVARAAAGLEEGTKRGIATSKALEAARERLAPSEAPAWLDEAAIPPGDGGWRAPSALALALVAATSWEGHEAIDKAGRILGDSDGVAALTGAFVGAWKGPGAFPVDWLQRVPEVSRIEALAVKMASRPGFLADG